ncbi:MAG TPA: AAA family ATPase, partial [Herpetosiphonaceae bacterium]|nr:AAA family ATPase [Herpetosiphonaceae bacterium]
TARLIQAALALSRLPGTAPARPRIGIAQGTARTGIYGGASRRTYGALGDAVNLAARLMDQARPGDILANDLIWQAAPPGIRWDVLPPRAIKGKQQDLILARLIDWADASRTAAEPRSGTPLVGRSPQLRIIRECLEQARRGHGHVVVISGDAGIGKSRVVSEIYQRQAGWQTLSGGGQSYRMAQPYSAWTPVWQRIFGMDPAMPAAANIERISAALAGWDPAQLDRLPLLSSVLSLAIPENSLTGGLEAKLRKSLLEALLADCFRAYANAMARSGRPVLIVIEDAHWLDQLSLDLVEHIGAIIADVPAALVVTTRTSGEGDGHPLAGLLARPHARSLTLHELAPAEVSELLALRWRQLNLHESTLTMERLREQIIPRSSGNPFFIEELVSFLATSPATLDEHTGWQGVELPQSLHRLVLSRIDRLEEHHQRVLKVASVLGTEFPQAWLEECYPAGEASGRIEHDLAVLKGHNLLSADSAPGMCRFRHAITQEITYESLAQRTQQALHEQVAGYLEGGAGPADQHLDLLAYHYGRSPNDRKALWYLARNAERAARLFANHDAVRDYQAALERAAGLRGELPFPAETLPRGLGDVYAQMAEFDAALERYAQALDLLPAESRLQRAEIHLQRAEVLTRATRFDQAAAEIEQGELLLNQADGPQAQTAARIMLARGAELRARTWMQQANSHKALEAAEQGLRYLEGIPPSHERAVTTRVKLQYALASAIAALRSYDQARRVLRHTLRLLRRVPNPAIEGELNVRWGTAALRHGYPRVAATMLKKAQPLVAA